MLRLYTATRLPELCGSSRHAVAFWRSIALIWAVISTKALWSFDICSSVAVFAADLSKSMCWIAISSSLLNGAVMNSSRKFCDLLAS